MGSVFSSSLVLTVLGCLQNSKRWRCLKFSVADVVSLELSLDNGHRLLLAPHHMRVRTRNGPSDRQFPQTQVGSPVASTSTLNTHQSIRAILHQSVDGCNFPSNHHHQSVPIRVVYSQSCKATRRRRGQFATGIFSSPSPPASLARSPLPSTRRNKTTAVGRRGHAPRSTPVYTDRHGGGRLVQL